VAGLECAKGAADHGDREPITGIWGWIACRAPVVVRRAESFFVHFHTKVGSKVKDFNKKTLQCVYGSNDQPLLLVSEGAAARFSHVTVGGLPFQNFNVAS